MTASPESFEEFAIGICRALQRAQQETPNETE